MFEDIDNIESGLYWVDTGMFRKHIRDFSINLPRPSHEYLYVFIPIGYMSHEVNGQLVISVIPLTTRRIIGRPYIYIPLNCIVKRVKS